jgi:hypothetical protein
MMNDWSLLKKLIYLKASVFASGGSSANVIVPTQTVAFDEDLWLYAIESFDITAFTEGASIKVTIDGTTFTSIVNAFRIGDEIKELSIEDGNLWVMTYYVDEQKLLLECLDENPPESITVTAIAE